MIELNRIHDDDDDSISKHWKKLLNITRISIYKKFILEKKTELDMHSLSLSLLPGFDEKKIFTAVIWWWWYVCVCVFGWNVFHFIFFIFFIKILLEINKHTCRHHWLIVKNIYAHTHIERILLFFFMVFHRMWNFFFHCNKKIPSFFSLNYTDREYSAFIFNRKIADSNRIIMFFSFSKFNTMRNTSEVYTFIVLIFFLFVSNSFNLN